jgi:glycine cleavage system H protein
MSLIPDELKYTKGHEWIRITNGEATLGITDYAQNELTDVIFVELPETGKKFKKGEIIAVVESVKSVSEMAVPFDCEVKDVNKDLDSSPEMLNQEPYGGGWLVTVTMEDAEQSSELLSSAEYKAHLGE